MPLLTAVDGCVSVFPQGHPFDSNSGCSQTGNGAWTTIDAKQCSLAGCFKQTEDPNARLALIKTSVARFPLHLMGHAEAEHLSSSATGKELLAFNSAETCFELIDWYLDRSLVFSHSKNLTPSLVTSSQPKWQ